MCGGGDCIVYPRRRLERGGRSPLKSYKFTVIISCERKLCMSEDVSRSHRRVHEDAVVPQQSVVGGGMEGQVAALARGPLLDLFAVRPATVHVQVEIASETAVAVREEVDQAVVTLGPQALADKVRPSRASLNRVDRGGMGIASTGIAMTPRAVRKKKKKSQPCMQYGEYCI